MPRRRTKPENKGLPKGWRYTHGAYYYHVPSGMESQWDGKQLFRLGKTLAEAHKTFFERLNEKPVVKNIAELLERYVLEVIPGKSPKTQIDNQRQMVRLQKAFGKLPLSPFKPQWIYAYIDARSAKVSAKREIEVLSHAFTKAVEWGYIDRHPFKGQIRITNEKPRDRYVEDWEIMELFKIKSQRKRGSTRAIQAYIKLKLLTGLRQGDLLRLTKDHLKEDGIHVQTHKTKKKTIYRWNDQLRQAVNEALATRPVEMSPYLFCTKKGTGYMNEKTGMASGWQSMWQRFIKRALKETDLKERFTEHDLRAKVGSDAESLEHAQALLSHTDPRTTKRIYRRKADVVDPLKR